MSDTDVHNVSHEEPAVLHVKGSKGSVATGNRLATQMVLSLIILSVLVSMVFEFDGESSVYQVRTPFVFSIDRIVDAVVVFECSLSEY